LQEKRRGKIFRRLVKMPRKKQKQKMVQHRGLESDNWAALPKEEQVVEMYNAYWRKFGLSEDLRVSPLDKGQCALIITDPTLMEVERKSGKVVFEDGMPKSTPGGSNGFYIDDPDVESTLEIVYTLLEAGVKGKHGIALPMDEMYDRNLDNGDRLTKTVLRAYALTPNQLKNMQKAGLQKKEGQPLTLVEFEKIFGEVKDKEFYCFPAHSTEGTVRLLPRFADAVKNQQQISTSGYGKSPIRIVPFQKDGLYPLVPPDERGQNSNHWDRMFDVWFSGRQGEEGRRERKVFVAGACIDYSVALTARWMKDTGYDVTIVAPAVKGLGITPKPVVLRELQQAYAIGVTWDWPSELGDKPKQWDKLVDKVRQADKKVLEAKSGPGSMVDYIKSLNQYL
jgi:hypothetical protein